MSSNSSAHNGLLVMLLMGLCTGIGLWLAVRQTNDVGTLIHWFWVGVGLAMIYLLTVIANHLEQFESNY